MVVKPLFMLVFLILAFIAKSQAENSYFEPVPAYSPETMIYSGIVTKITDNTPVDSVEISVEEYGIVGYTNSEGIFKVEAPVNISKLNLNKLGYISVSIVFVIDNERKKTNDIKMFSEEPDEKEQAFIQKTFQLSSPDNALNKEKPLLKATEKTEVPATIRVLMPDNSVVVMNMDEYLKGVVPSEVPPSWNMNALKAQAVAARSYATANFKHNSEGADVCTTTHCQAWKSVHYQSTDQAVTETSKVSVKYGGNIIDALFFSHCNGYTRNNEDVWGGTPVPYLRSKSCICGYTSHNAHGVGMCQYGCQAMATNGSTWESILTYYYTGTSVDKPTMVALGTLKGVIYHGTDNSNLNNRIIGATVKVNTGEEVASGEYGLYSFDLTPGQYTVTASKSGFQNNSVTREVTSGTTIWGSIQLSLSVGLSDVLVSRVLIYPNPAKDFINIESNGKTQVIITDLTGRIVFNEIIHDKATINTGNYKSGIYLVKIIGADYIVSEKVILLD